MSYQDSLYQASRDRSAKDHGMRAAEERQKNLFPEHIQATVQPDSEADQTAQERFDAFHATNPHVYELCVKEAMSAQSRGWSHWAIKGIFEILRWKRSFQTSDSDFKINNNHAPFYARLIMLDFPQLDGFFVVRKAEADEVKP
jgi:hypothetical protein